MYDENNYINQTFYTELNKKLQIYWIISTSAIGIVSTTKLVRIENSLKFNVVVNDKYMDHIVLQLEDIRKAGKIETKDAKVTNFLILSTKPKWRISSKGKMSYQIIDEIKIVGLQNFSLNEELNVEITIHDSEIQSKLSRYGNQCYIYRSIVNSLLISSWIVQESNVIFLVSNGLHSARASLINGKIYKSVCVINVNKITNWTQLKGKSKWVTIQKIQRLQDILLLHLKLQT